MRITHVRILAAIGIASLLLCAVGINIAYAYALENIRMGIGPIPSFIEELAIRTIFSYPRSTGVALSVVAVVLLLAWWIVSSRAGDAQAYQKALLAISCVAFSAVLVSSGAMGLACFHAAQ